MIYYDLNPIQHKIKVGDVCDIITPNITEDCTFRLNGAPIGFYLRKLPTRAEVYADIANQELRTKRVPKTEMQRPKMLGMDANGKGIVDRSVRQFSTILGGIPAKPHMKRPYNSISSVHAVKSAKDFIKAMMILCKECEDIVRDLLPDQFNQQLQLLQQVPEQYRFGRLFTSSISNYNISAPYHKDTGNIPGTVNCIVTKRLNSHGGNLNVPDYDLTVDQCDNSLLVYPAWANVHGVTPIIPTFEGGYRNSLIFYPLKAFNNK